MRHDGRRADELRALDIEPDYLEQPHGSVLYAQGKTIVLCTATVEEEVPRWLRKSGRGWMTAEYAMLPASTGERTQRAVSRGRPDGRTVEIQRLIGRALRSVCDFEALGERTLWLDCDVLQADGGTRCASITGAWIAARRALDRFGLSKALPGTIAAVSVGIVNGEAVLDLDYEEDSSAETDMNVVMTGDGRLVEVQATAERDPFSRELLDALLDLAAGGIEELAAAQARRCRDATSVGARYLAPTHANPPRLERTRTSSASFAPRSRSGRSRSWRRPTSRSRTARRSSTTRGSRPDTAARSLPPTRGSRARTPGSRSPRWVDGPACTRPGGRRTESRSFSSSSTGRRTAARATCASSSCSLPTAPRCARQGRWTARSQTRRRGDEGFGYDPIFVPHGETRTVAELGDAWKAEHSHRAQAARLSQSASHHALARYPPTGRFGRWTRPRRSGS